jgi:hypothetical protein
MDGWTKPISLPGISCQTQLSEAWVEGDCLQQFSLASGHMQTTKLVHIRKILNALSLVELND